MGYDSGTMGVYGGGVKFVFRISVFACSKENVIFVVCYSVQFENYNYAGHQFIRVEEQHGEVS